MVRVIISGIMGRMGRTIAKLAYEDPDIEIVAGIESPDCAHYHNTVGEVIGVELNAPVTSDLSKVIEFGDVIIDFANNPEAVLGHLRLAAADKNRKAMVIGTTGFNDEQINEIKELSKDVNLLFKLVQEAAKILKDKGFDIEVVEMHHRYKKDSPSGTAVKLVDILKNETGINRVIYGREGHYEGGRPSDEIAVFALRGGDVVGEHSKRCSRSCKMGQE